jgi:hypothetical protein
MPIPPHLPWSSSAARDHSRKDVDRQASVLPTPVGSSASPPKLYAVDTGFSLEKNTSNRQEGGFLYPLSRYLQSQVLESFNEVAFQVLSIDPVEVVCPQCPLRLFGFEYLIDNAQNAMDYGDNGPLLPLTSG